VPSLEEYLIKQVMPYWVCRWRI